jgi:hypothetical protein
MELLLLVREFIMNLTGYDVLTFDYASWIIAYWMWCLFGWFIIFVLNVGGFHTRLEMYRHIDRKVAFFATGLVVMFWVFAPFIVDATERRIMRRQGTIRS